MQTPADQAASEDDLIFWILTLFIWPERKLSSDTQESYIGLLSKFVMVLSDQLQTSHIIRKPVYTICTVWSAPFLFAAWLE